MSKDKKIPRYLQVQAPKKNVKKQPKDGNPQQVLVHEIVCRDDKERIIIDRFGNPVTEVVRETYVFNQDHRRNAKDNKGIWYIGEQDELVIFKKTRHAGCVTPWKKNQHMGWGVFIKDGKAEVLGNDYEAQPVRVCKFLEGNQTLWHGFPINYRLESEEKIKDHVLQYWALGLKVIDKSEINDIKKHEASTLSL